MNCAISGGGGSRDGCAAVRKKAVLRQPSLTCNARRQEMGRKGGHVHPPMQQAQAIAHGGKGENEGLMAAKSSASASEARLAGGADRRTATTDTGMKHTVCRGRECVGFCIAKRQRLTMSPASEAQHYLPLSPAGVSNRQQCASGGDTQSCGRHLSTPSTSISYRQAPDPFIVPLITIAPPPEQ